MIEPRANLLLLGNRRRYAPGDELSIEYRLTSVPPDALESVEISVLWHSEGKGDEDLAVHFFERLDGQGGAGPPPSKRFVLRLPLSPLSYQGVIVKLRWCARVRAFLSGGKQLVDEQMFHLGDVAPARAVLP